MRIVAKATQLELTDALYTYVVQRFLSVEKLVRSFEAGGELTLKIELARSTRHHSKGNVYYVECTLPILKNVIRIEQYDKDVRAAVDKAQRRFKVEVERIKEKMQRKDKKAIERLRNK